MLRILVLAGAVLFAGHALAAGELGAADDPDAIADLRIAHGERNIAEAWLIAPTTRYDHFVIGSRYEAGGLRLRTAGGTVLTLMLDEQHVFEDRTPRLADLDGDGRDEIVLVLSSLREGASLAVFDVADSEIRLKARTPFIGLPHRWLNPAGIADFDGDGQLDIAFVAMPHLAERLEVWTLSDGALHQIGTLDGVSNHRLGSRHTGMSATGDFNGDGVTDLAVPGSGRRDLPLVTFAGAKAAEIDRHPLSGQADGEIEATRSGTEWHFLVPLQRGRVERLTWSPNQQRRWRS